MNHPTHEEWMSYLYGELTDGERARLAEHAHDCQDCAALVREWQTVRKQLDTWKVRPSGAQSSVQSLRLALAAPAFKWAAAALVVLAVGFGAGRFTSPTVNLDHVRASIEPKLRRQLRQEFAQWLQEKLDNAQSATLAASARQTKEMLADFDARQQARHDQDSQAVAVALDRMDARNAADYLSLKKQLDTVAVLTDAGLRQTEQQLVRLASYTPPAGFSGSPPE